MKKIIAALLCLLLLISFSANALAEIRIVRLTVPGCQA